MTSCTIQLAPKQFARSTFAGTASFGEIIGAAFVEIAPANISDKSHARIIGNSYGATALAVWRWTAGVSFENFNACEALFAEFTIAPGKSPRINMPAMQT
jgi:hypothetical protein